MYESNHTLFRPEVTENRSRRLYGEVVLGHSLSTRVLTLALAGVGMAAGVWLALGSFARIETAPGVLVTLKPSAKVIAPSPGVIVNLTVREGSRVHRGDRLAMVTLDRRAENGGGFAGEGLAALRQRMAMTEAQIALADTRLTGERQRLRSTLDAVEDEVRQLEGQIELQNEAVASNHDLFSRVEKVVERGFVSRFEYERRRQLLLASRQSLGDLKQRRAAALARGDQTRAQLAVLQSENAAQVSELRSGRLALAQQEAQLRSEEAYALIAPVDGVVTAMQTAEGRTAMAGATLMTVLPEATTLQAEIYAPSRAIGLVRSGQETRLLFDAFPYQRFGSFGGRVSYVSRIAIDPRENEALVKTNEPVYRIVVTLDQQTVEAYGAPVPLQPGMTLTANIVLERQSFFAWLLTPLNAVLNRTR